jgi:opacity protein-like surface antigen
MKRFLIAISLACALSGPALAGDMPAVGQSPAPGETSSPPAPAEIQGVGSFGEMPISGLSALLTILDLAF